MTTLSQRKPRRFPFVSRQAASRQGTVLAALDLGTTSCRLLVARPEGTSFRVIDSFSRVVRLGEGIQTNNRLQPGAITRTLEALKICRDKISRNNVTKIRAVTTEACRRAENSAELLDRARTDLHIDIEVITPLEEARLALAGCAAILDPGIPYAVAFDIGGGSTEIIWLKLMPSPQGRRSRIPVVEVIDCASLPFGVVTLSEIYGTRFTDFGIYQDLRKKVADEVHRFTIKNNIQAHIQNGQVQMAGTSGTITTIGAVHLNLPKYDRRLIDGLFLQLQDIHHVSKQLLAMTQLERAQSSCIGPGRADLVLMGTAILEGICDVWTLPRLRVADRGVREGILMDLLEEV
ncbi:MAG: exopolyphosphatase [Alphaproteobacteria bacterium]|nr:exopolyphosphatase [Alphaproteobacteria bacterium]